MPTFTLLPSRWRQQSSIFELMNHFSSSLALTLPGGSLGGPPDLMMDRGSHFIKFCFSRISPEGLAGVPGVSVLEVRLNHRLGGWR